MQFNERANMNTSHNLNTKLKTLPAALVLALLTLGAPAAWAQENQAIPAEQTAQPQTQPAESNAPNPLQQSVIKGLQNSPALDADVHALEAQIEEANVVFGTMLPTVDARGSAGPLVSV